MPFEFTCPYCYKKTIVDEALAGERGACVSCGKIIQVPEPPNKRSQALEKRGVNPKTRWIAWFLKALVLVVVCIVLIGTTIFILWPSLEGLKKRRDKQACMYNLQQIAQALNAYAADHGTYPPPTVYGPAGKPLYSWRVLVLPYLGEEVLYKRFRLKEPWDSQQNAALTPLCPKVFVSPGTDTGTWIAESSYVLVTGKGTLFPPTGPLGPGDISDGAKRTLLVVESGSVGKTWAEPCDIDFSKFTGQIGGQALGTMNGNPTSIGGTHDGGAAVVFADGVPGWLPEDVSRQAVNAMVSPRGGEPVNTDGFRDTLR